MATIPLLAKCNHQLGSLSQALLNISKAELGFFLAPSKLQMLILYIAQDDVFCEVPQ
jgi:hypothetical protein